MHPAGGTALFLALRQIRHRRLRSATIGLVVALAVSCVATVTILDRNTILTRQWVEIRRRGDPDVVMTFAPTPMAEVPALLESVRTHPEARAVVAFLRWSAPGDTATDPVYVVTGEREAFRCLEVPAGATVVAGPSESTPLRPFRLGRSEFVPTGRAGRLYFAANPGDRAYYVLEAPVAFPADLRVRPVLWVRTEKPDRVRAAFVDRAMTRDAPHRSRWKTPEDVAMRAAVKLASLLALVLSAFVLGHTTRLSLLTRARELAVLRALGATRSRIVRQGLLEILLLAVPMALLGLLAGAAFAFVLGRLGISTLGRQRLVFFGGALPVAELLAVFSAGVLLPLVGAWLSLRVIHRLDVPAALGPVFQSRPPTRGRARFRDLLAILAAIAAALSLAWAIAGFEDPKVEAVLLRGVLLTLAAATLVLFLPALLRLVALRLAGAMGRLFGPMGRLAAQTFGSGYLPALAGVVGVFAIVLTLQNLVASMDAEIEGWGRKALDGRTLLEFREPVTAERISGADVEVMPVVGEWLRPFHLRAVDPDRILAAEGISISPEERQALGALARGEGVIVSRAFAIQHGVARGGRVTLTTTDGIRSVPVIEVTDRFGALALDRAYALAGEIPRGAGTRPRSRSAAPPVPRLGEFRNAGEPAGGGEPHPPVRPDRGPDHLRRPPAARSARKGP